MHTYATSGSYVISYLAIERDLITGLICFEQILYDTIFLSCGDSWCPLNVVQNGDFSVGVPTPGDQDICNALRWCGIWPGGSTGDFYNSSTAPPPGAPPTPLSQGNYGAFWCRKQGAQTVWREGIMNELQYAILPNTGCYELTFKMACTGSYFGSPILNAYGVNAPGLASGTTPVDGNTPLNSGLFPAGALVQLGSHPIPVTCNNDFLNPAQTIAFTVNSNTFPAAGVTHIFFTRDDNTNGGVYLALDDVCLKSVACSDTCTCGGFTDMFIRGPQGLMSRPAVCGGPPVGLGCAPSGNGYMFTGIFQCDGAACPDSTNIDWGLLGPNGGSIASGMIPSNPFFGIPLLASYFVQPGLYTLNLTGYCGNDTCACTITLLVPECPDPCPCDLPTLISDVDQGFAAAYSTNSCSVCFTPLGLSDCDDVEWMINSPINPPVGASLGNQTFCHTFPSSGTYTVYMTVLRRRSDGSLCESWVYSRTIMVNCTRQAECETSVNPNPTFEEGAVLGSFLEDGATAGWTRYWGDPHVDERNGNKVIKKRGNFNSADVTGAIEPVCLAKDTGTISLRFGIKEKGIRSAIVVQFFSDDVYEFGVCESATCYEVARLELPDSDNPEEEFDVEIPYDIRNWAAAAACGDESGVRVRPAIFVTSPFSDEQGPGSLTIIDLDYFCVDGSVITGTRNPKADNPLRLFPNPTANTITLQLPAPATAGTSFRLLSLTGQVMLQQPVEPGLKGYTFDLSPWPAGMYFIQLWQDGRPSGTAKIVRQ
jgi:hypothetical protein